ncbi:hypothetical protein EVAR_76970_1 [Eumeta japonica]|uniref:Uncharacterized protein n=1 Tax=Eumeta variegata TaxID=151549 RepID=A0A4C1SF10_EUMVA|nr:hypothetical protein EVAR_76970_1 [Eumeta japonica]
MSERDRRHATEVERQRKRTGTLVPDKVAALRVSICERPERLYKSFASKRKHVLSFTSGKRACERPESRLLSLPMDTSNLTGIIGALPDSEVGLGYLMKGKGSMKENYLTELVKQYYLVGTHAGYQHGHDEQDAQLPQHCHFGVQTPSMRYDFLELTEDNVCLGNVQSTKITNQKKLASKIPEVRASKLRERSASKARKFYEYPWHVPRAGCHTTSDIPVRTTSDYRVWVLVTCAETDGEAILTTMKPLTGVTVMKENENIDDNDEN